MSAQFDDQFNVDLNNKVSDQMIKTGFKNPVHDAQSIFRKVLKSMSEPGITSTVDTLLDDKPETLFTATYAIALALFDHDTEIFLSESLANDTAITTLRFHCSSVISNECKTVDFLVCSESDIPDLGTLKIGTESYPDQSCTLIVQAKSLSNGERFDSVDLDELSSPQAVLDNSTLQKSHIFTGAGIKDKHLIQCSALTDSFIQQREALQKLFPLGVDVIFTCEDKLFCLPRTTIINSTENGEASSCM